MGIPIPAPVKTFSTGRTEDGNYVSLLFECHDGTTHAVAVPHQALDGIIASLIKASRAAAQARGEREH
jgi:hypothetical protein